MIAYFGPWVTTRGTSKRSGLGAMVTSHGKKSRHFEKTLQLIWLFASLALLVSLASPADDDLQQESLPCRKHQSDTVSKATHRADALVRIPSSTGASVARPRVRTLCTWVSATTEHVLLPDNICRLAADLPPPTFLL